MAKKLNLRQQRYIEAKKTAKTKKEAAIMAGYSPKTADVIAAQLEKKLAGRIQALGEVGLDTLEEVARGGKVEVARVQAAKHLTEVAYGKPKDNTKNTIGNVTINIEKIEPNQLGRITSEIT